MQFDTMRVSRAPGPGSTPSDRILDKAVIADLREAVGDEILVELIDTFVADVPSQINAIEAADSALTLSRTAHRLKGGSLSLGLVEVRDLCLRLEDAGRRGQLHEVDPEIKSVRGAVSRAIQALKALPR